MRAVILCTAGVLALTDLNFALEIDPYSVIGLLHRGHLFLREGDRDRAFEDLDRAVELAPTDIRVLKGRAVARAVEAEYALATEDLTACIAVQPRLPDCYILRGDMYAAMGEMKPNENR
jgi:tetratricopeptide (TPR) repeat protein